MSKNTKRTVLSNGLTVITKESRQVPITSFWVWYKVGSRNELPGTTGISHWVEHMLFQGTPTLGKGDIFRKVAANGGVLNGFTWLDYTTYFETLPSNRVDLSLEIESDRMANSLFDPDEVERERTVIISEREGSENSPTYLLGEEMNSAAFQSHPYGHSVVGWKSDLTSMTREDLYRHYRTYYSPNNATVVLVGDFDTDQILEKIREKFEPIPAGAEVPRVRAQEPPQRGERRVIVRYPAGVPHFEVAYHAPASSNPDTYPMLVLDAILSGGKGMGVFGSRGTRMGRSSRLYRALVDGGLASYAGSSMAMTKDPYLFDVDASLRTGVTLEQVEAAVFAEIKKLQTELVSQDEFQRALKQVRAQFVYGSESISDQAYWLGSMETTDRFEVYYEMLDRIEKVTPEEVKQAAESYLTETNRTVGWLIPTDEAGGGQNGGGMASARPFFFTPRATQNSGGPGRISVQMDRRELKNGPVVLVHSDPSTPQVVVRANLLGGSVFDPADKSGLARFVAPMLIRGTEARSFQQLSEETDSLGMALNSDAGRFTSQISLRCLKEDLPRGMELLAEVLRRPAFPEDEMERLRGQTIAGLKEMETSPRAVAERAFLEETYPDGHPYHSWPVGTVDTVESFTQDDLVRFYRAYYRPDQMTVAIAGDLTVDEAVSQLERVLGDWKAEGEAPQFQMPDAALPASKTREEVVSGKFQSEMVMGLPAISRLDPDYYPLRLGNLILGELGLSGRLGANIRDGKGLAYHVSSDVQASIGPSPWAIRAGVNPTNVDKAIEAAMWEIDRWRTELVSEDELADSKSFLTGSMPIALETIDGVARTMLDIEFYHLGLDFLERYPSLVQAVTREQIREAVRKWIHPDHMIVVVAGPKRQVP